MVKARLLCLSVACILLLSCAAPIAPPPPDSGGGRLFPQGGPVVITFGVQEHQRSTYEPLIAQFQHEQPTIRVQLVAVDPVYAQQRGTVDPESVLRQIVALADTAVVYTLPEAALQRGFLRDLAPLIDADPTFDPSDFYPGALERTRVDGAQYGVPIEVTAPLLAYNRDLWSVAGLPPPRLDWAWRDLLAAAEALARPGSQGMEVYGIADWGAYLLLSTLVQEQDPAFAWGEAGQARLDAPAAEAALTRLAALVQSGAVFYLPPTSTPEVLGAAVRAGRVGMWDSSLLARTPDDPPLAFAVGTAVLPPVQGSDVRFGRELVMSRGTRHPEASWRWIAFLSRQAVPPAGSPTTPPSTVPARRSIVQRSGLLAQLDGEARAALEATLERPAESPVPFDPPRDQALGQAIDAVLSGRQAPAAALAEAQRRYAQSLADVLPTPSPAPPDPIIVASPIPTVAARADVPRITFTAMWANSLFQPLVDAFNREHPEMYVELKADAMRSGSFRLADVARESDVVMWTGPVIGPDRGAVLDLRLLADADPRFEPDDFPLALRTRFGDDQALYGVPYQLSLWVLAYNPELFAAAGVAPPQPDWTLDDLVLAAEALSGGDEPERRYGFFNADTALLHLFLEHEGAELVLGSGASAQPNYTDPKVAGAAQRFIRFARTSTPSTSLSGYRATSGAADTSITEGRVAMWFVFFGPLLDSTQQRIPVAIAPVPRTRAGERRLPFAASALFVSAETQHPREAWAFVSWMSRNPLVTSGYVPARISLARAPSFQQAMPPGMADVYAAYAEALQQPDDTSRYRAGGAGAVAVDPYWFYRAVDRALQQPGLDVEHELGEAQRLTEAYLSCARGGEPPARCARDVDPTYEAVQQLTN